MASSLVLVLVAQESLRANLIEQTVDALCCSDLRMLVGHLHCQTLAAFPTWPPCHSEVAQDPTGVRHYVHAPKTVASAVTSLHDLADRQRQGEWQFD